MPLFTRFGIIWRLFGPALVLVILVAVACGEAAAPTSPPPAVQATEAPQAATQPTAVPAPTSPPVVAKVKVHPGTLTWMIGNFGHERFDPTYGSSEGHDYGRLLHAFLISSEVKDGRRVAMPGIVTK